MLNKQASPVLRRLLLKPSCYLQTYWPFLGGDFVNALELASLPSLVFNSVTNPFL